jgi:pimeloyl-ACP methyl ester carboxylesterase
MGDELIWQSGFQDAPGTRRYGPRLAEECRVRVLYLRFNSGLHLSENGRALNALLTQLVETYPDAIGELVLVGHSMGGLIIRSAGYYATEPAERKDAEPEDNREGLEREQDEARETGSPEADTEEPSAFNAQLSTQKAPWLAHLRSIFLLGTPNDGSWLEQNSHLAAQLLERINLFPARFLSKALNRRSNGIKDLRRSILVDKDWQDPHADDFFSPRTQVLPLSGVQYHILLGSWLRTTLPTAVREYFGDGLVGQNSAFGATVFGNEASLPAGTTVRTCVFSQQHHGGLLTHPEVFQYLKQWA